MGSESGASIMLNNTLFVFGASNGSSHFNKWPYISTSDAEVDEAIEPTTTPS